MGMETHCSPILVQGGRQAQENGQSVASVARNNASESLTKGLPPALYPFQPISSTLRELYLTEIRASARLISDAQL